MNLYTPSLICCILLLAEGQVLGYNCNENIPKSRQELLLVAINLRREPIPYIANLANLSPETCGEMLLQYTIGSGKADIIETNNAAERAERFFLYIIQGVTKWAFCATYSCELATEAYTGISSILGLPHDGFTITSPFTTWDETLKTAVANVPYKDLWYPRATQVGCAVDMQTGGNGSPYVILKCKFNTFRDNMNFKYM